MAYVGLLLAVVADTTLRLLAPDAFWLQTAPPSLPLVTAIYIGFRARNTRQLGFAIVLGVLADCFSAAPIGHFAFLYGTAAYLALRVRRYVPSDALASHVVASLFCGVVTAFLGLLIASVRPGGASGAGLSRALIQVTMSASLAPFVFGMWDRSRFFKGALRGRGYEFA